MIKNPRELIKNCEVLGITETGFKILLFNPGCATHNLLREIEQLSYESFKEDGHNLACPSEIDPIDKIYSHLILWDEVNCKIAGWYRFSKAMTIINAQGIQGLYASSLFHFNNTVQKKIYFGFEMGRSFIQSNYRNTLALAYLWGGILKYILREGNIKYIYGLMSIGGYYPTIVTAMITYFYSLYFGKNINNEVIPNHQYIISDSDLNEIKSYLKGDDYRHDFTQLNEQLKKHCCSIPNAVKHGMNFFEKEGTELAAAGVDIDFGNCIDLFMIGDVQKIKPLFKNKYLKLIV